MKPNGGRFTFDRSLIRLVNLTRPAAFSVARISRFSFPRCATSCNGSPGIVPRSKQSTPAFHARRLFFSASLCFPGSRWRIYHVARTDTQHNELLREQVSFITISLVRTGKIYKKRGDDEILRYAAAHFGLTHRYRRRRYFICTSSVNS